MAKSRTGINQYFLDDKPNGKPGHGIRDNRGAHFVATNLFYHRVNGLSNAKMH
jgi:hypothetical protein